MVIKAIKQKVIRKKESPLSECSNQNLTKSVKLYHV